MKSQRKLLFLITVISFFSAIINFPRDLPLSLTWPVKIDMTISSPDIDIRLGQFHFFRKTKLRLGLDLQGGTQLVYEADMSQVDGADRDIALEAVREVIDRRVNFYGVTEPVIQTAKVAESYRLIVELPGIKDIDEAINLIGKTAQLNFKEQEASPSAEATDEAYFFLFTKDTNLSGKHLKRSQVQFDPNTGEPVVSLEFDSEGSNLFAEITSRNIGKPVAIFLDNELLSAPIVQEVISGGNAVIRGGFTGSDARTLSIALNAGALPAPVKIINQRNIGATLGEKSFQESVKAGILGLTTVWLFMFFYYRKWGLLADISLFIYILIVLSIFKLIPVTLTLAGISGFILSIGMAVDANILIFERIKEELRSGRILKIAIELGFSRAFPSIRDSNVSSLITCAILYWFGTGSVRGFALTLAIGILVSLFTSITVTRTLLRALSSGK